MTGPSRGCRQRSTVPTRPTRLDVAGRRHVRRHRGLVRPPDRPARHATRRDEAFTTEYFGPILTVHVYDDADYHRVLTQMESAAPYALTGAVVAQDRDAIAEASELLRFAAGNFYVNDKPTGAVVGQQPFGGGRASGTNDKAGAPQNLLRWTSTAVDQGDPRAAEGPPIPAPRVTYG